MNNAITVEKLQNENRELQTRCDSAERKMADVILRNIELVGALSLYQAQHNLQAGGTCNCQVCGRVQEIGK